jgi:hypothetical protein
MWQVVRPYAHNKIVFLKRIDVTINWPQRGYPLSRAQLSVTFQKLKREV